MSNPVARKLAIVLAVSLGLNLFLGGMIASAWISRQVERERPAGPALSGKFDFRAGLEVLGTAARPMAREIRREFGPRLRESGGEVRIARRRVGDLMRAGELDTQALEAAFRDLRQATDAAQAVMHQALLETMERLSPEQRRAFLDAAMPPAGADRRLRRETPGAPQRGR